MRYQDFTHFLKFYVNPTTKQHFEDSIVLNASTALLINGFTLNEFVCVLIMKHDLTSIYQFQNIILHIKQYISPNYH